MKICIYCKLEQSLENFSKAKSRSGGFRNWCKKCRNIKSRAKDFEPANIQYKKCKTCQIEKSIKYFHINRRNLDGYEKDCKECRQIKTKNNYIKNKQKIKNKVLEYYKNNRKKALSGQLKRQKERLKTDDFYKLQRNLRNRLYYALKNTEWKKNTHFADYIGCEREILISHLEKQFQPNMSWDNYGEWEIDHIKPLANAVTEQELYNLCHYTNLQPLWKLDNVKKSNR
jgi:hypothetical protein